MMDYEKIIDALETIKEMCCGKACVNCPLGDEIGNCKLSFGRPEHLDIIDYPIRLLK